MPEFAYDDLRRFGVGQGGDETRRIQNGLDSVARAGGGISVAPPGILQYTTISIPGRVTLRGAGIDRTTFERLGPVTRSGSGHVGLFGIKLVGSEAQLQDCRCIGLWDPARPTNLTYDVNVGVVGSNVQGTQIRRVDSSRAHIGFLVGGIIGSRQGATFSGQNNTVIANCVARDTVDLGFGLVAKDRSGAGTSLNCTIMDCSQQSSLSSAGLEVRFQQQATILRFVARSNRHEALGAAVRVEEANGVTIQETSARDCAMGVQVVHDSFDCRIQGLAADSCTHGVYIRQSSDVTIQSAKIRSSGREGVILTYLDGTRWKRVNERVGIHDSLIDGSGRSGVLVAGRGFREAASARNGSGLQIIGTTIARSGQAGVTIGAGGDFLIDECEFDDNGTGRRDASGCGVYVENPSPANVRDLSKPAGGLIARSTFRSSGRQPLAILDSTLMNGKSLTKVVDIRRINGLSR